jgi:L-iditol 2-dehydrogenase
MPAPSPQAGEVLVRVGACGVCGSDIPRVFLKGTYRFPTVPGHEFAGVVEALGPDVAQEWSQRRVAVFPLLPCRKCGPCLVGAYAQCEDYDYIGSRSDGAFAEYVRVPVWNLVPVPDGVALEEAAMTEPAAVAVHALRQGGLDVGDAIAIYGAGPIGLMIAQWARAWGAGRVLMVDVDPDKLDFARNLGFDNTCNGRETDAPRWIREATDGRGADLVVEASGASQAFEQCMFSARTFGRVVLMGNPAGDMTLSQDGYWAILRKELRVAGTWNSTYGVLPRDEWRLALDFMATGRLDLKPLITHRVDLDSLPETLAMVRDKREFANKVMYVDSRTDQEGNA